MGPFIKSTNNTKKMMLNLLIALLPIIVFAFIKNGIIPFTKGYVSVFGLFYPLIFIGISMSSTFVFEILYSIIFLKNKSFKGLLKNNYSIFSGLFLSLILPINTNLVLLLLASLISFIIGKTIFSCFGKNILNPALVGSLLITIVYLLKIVSPASYFNDYEIDTINVINVIGIGNYDSLIKPYGNLSNFFVGTIPGTLGGTSALLCIVSFIYLTYFKVIKWRIPVAYVLTVFSIAYVVGGMHNLGIWYPLFQIFTGGILFGAVFIATDSTTSPVTPIGQVLYGLFLGILTVIFRYLIPFSEGAFLSILIMNLTVSLFDKIGSISRFNFKVALMPFIVSWVLIILLSEGISLKYNTTEENNATKVDYVETFE